MSAQLEELVESLLYEGYALYPYTPGATKNATPTPFGIVYPPAYAERNPSCHSLLRIQCVVEGEGDVWAEVLFLQGSGERHEADRRRIELTGPGESEFHHPPLHGRASMRVEDRERRPPADHGLRAQRHRHGRSERGARGRADALPALHPRGSAHGGRALPLAAGRARATT